MKTSRYTKHLLLATSIISLGFVCNSKATHAAFEWTPPPVVEKPAAVVIVEPTEDDLMPAPIDDVSMRETLPVIPAENVVIQNDTMPAPVEYIEGEEPKEMMLSVPADSEIAEELIEIIEEAEENNVITPMAEIPAEEKIDSMPAEAKQVTVKVVDTPVLEPTQKTAVVAPTLSSDPNIVRGFGNDLPLVMAVRQIIPSNVPYAFGESIDMGIPVSWEGGKTWQQTMDMIAAANNMQVEYGDNLVQIVSKDIIQQPQIETVRIDPVQENLDVTPETAENTNVVMADPIIIQEPQIAENAVIPDPDLMSLEDVVKVADAEIKAKATISNETDLVITEITEDPTEVIVVDDVQSPPFQAGVTVLKETMADENEVLEATISDAIIISPIEDMENLNSLTVSSEQSEDMLSAGTIIGQIDAPSPIASIEELPMEENEIDMTTTVIAEPVTQSAMDDVIANVQSVEEGIIVIEEESSAPVLLEQDVTIVANETIEETLSDANPVENIETLAENAVNDLNNATEGMVQMQEIITVQPSPSNVVVIEEQDILSDMVEQPPVEELASVATISPEPQTAIDIEPQPEVETMVMQEPVEIDLVKTWKVKKDSDLKSTLEAWTEDAGINLQWNMQQDYNVGYMVWVDGSFQEAIDVLMQGYSSDKGLIPSATLNRDAAGQPVLIIEPAA